MIEIRVKCFLHLEVILMLDQAKGTVDGQC